jgi:hypothetical protein
MPKYVMAVMTRPASPDREDEFNEWYTNTHIGEVISVPGFTGARRLKQIEALKNPTSPEQDYLALYEVEADDIGTVLAEVGARAGDGRIAANDVMVVEVSGIYEVISEASN